MRCLLVNKAKTINQLRLIDGATKLLADMDVAQVNIGGSGLVDNFENGIDSHGGQKRVVVGDDLGRERSDRVLDELVTVVEVNRLGDLINNFHGLSVSNLEAIRDSGGVKALGHQFSACLEEGTSHNDDGSGSITSLNVLSLGNFDQLKKNTYISVKRPTRFILNQLLTILAVGWMTSICLRMVAPSLVMSTLPLGV